MREASIAKESGGLRSQNVWQDMVRLTGTSRKVPERKSENRTTLGDNFNGWHWPSVAVRIQTQVKVRNVGVGVWGQFKGERLEIWE